MGNYARNTPAFTRRHVDQRFVVWRWFYCVWRRGDEHLRDFRRNLLQRTAARSAMNLLRRAPFALKRGGSRVTDGVRARSFGAFRQGARRYARARG